jgi:hypothetical protein
MKWKLARIDWHSMNQCWTWRRVQRFVYYSGNQVQITWGRLAFVFERRTWLESANADHHARPEAKRKDVA